MVAFAGDRPLGGDPRGSDPASTWGAVKQDTLNFLKQQGYNTVGKDPFTYTSTKSAAYPSAINRAALTGQGDAASFGGGGGGGGGGGYGYSRRGYGGYGYGGGGGFDYSDPNVGSAVRDELYAWFGVDWVNAHPEVTRSLLDLKATQDDVRRYAVANGANGPLMQQVRNGIVQDMVRGGIPRENVTDSFMNAIIRDGIYQDATYFRETYVPNVAGFDVSKSPEFARFVDYWTQQTGIAPTWTAISWVHDKVRQVGWDGAWADWQGWVLKTDSAKTGNYGAQRRLTIGDAVRGLLGREPTAEELDPRGLLWDANDAKVIERIRATPEYAVKYAGKPADMSEATFNAKKPAYDAVWRRIYGERVMQPDEVELAPKEPVQPRTTPDAAGKTPAAKNAADVNEAELDDTEKAVLKLFRDRGLDPGLNLDGTFEDATARVKRIANDIRTGKRTLEAVAGSVGNINAKYPGGQGAPKRPTAPTLPPGAVTSTPTPLPVAPGGMPTDVLAYYLKNNVSPDEIWQQASWLEDVDYMKATLNPNLERAFGAGQGFTDDELYKIASGAKGSGALRARALEAQNRLEFREVFKMYTGKEATATDYDNLTNNFVSPNEYAKRMAARESAKAKLPEVNELLGRTLGRTVSLAELENMAVGGEGSGELEAAISQATRLDAYRWVFKQYNNREPTPGEYQGFTGMAGPAELQWQYATHEAIGEYRNEIQELWQSQYNKQLSEQELQTLFGEQKGYGELKGQWTKAKKMEAEKKQAERERAAGEKVNVLMSQSGTGGFKEMMPGLASLN